MEKPYIMIDKTAMSRGYRARTKTTPTMYHMTPLVCFCSAGQADRRSEGIKSLRRRKIVICESSAYLFALTHKEANHFFISALERGVVEPEDIGRHDDEHRAGKGDNNALWRAMRGIKVERHKT